MRVVHLTSVHPWDDIRIFTKMCRTLAAAGHDVHLVAPRADRDRAEAVDGVMVHPIPPAAGRLTRVTATMQAALRTGASLGGELYHFHDPEFLTVAPRWQRRLGAPFVYDAHEDYREGIRDKSWLPGPVRRPLAWAVGRVEDWAASRLSGVVAATPAIGERFLRHPRLAIVQNLPLLAEFPEPPAAGAATPGLFAYVGVISANRGAFDMVRALTGTSGAATLALAGDFSPPGLRDECARLPGWSQVRATGFLNRTGVQALLAESVAGIVVFHPDRNHVRAQPNKLFEYMAAGLPAIVSDFPLWRSIVEQAGCGLAVDPLNPEAIAGAMRWIVAHPAEAAAMGARGRQAAIDRLNWESESRKLLALYEAVERTWRGVG